MKSYNNSTIYKIISNNSDDIYIGSSVQNLRSRLAQHSRDFRAYNKGTYNKYCTSYKIIEQGDYDIIELEKVCCNDKQELHKRERDWIERLECVNKNIPCRTKKEYYLDNKDSILENRKDYYLDNKDSILENHKAYYLNNKDSILEYKSQKITCECGLQVSKSSLSRHKKSSRHKMKLEICLID